MAALHHHRLAKVERNLNELIAQFWIFLVVGVVVVVEDTEVGEATTATASSKFLSVMLCKNSDVYAQASCLTQGSARNELTTTTTTSESNPSRKHGENKELRLALAKATRPRNGEEEKCGQQAVVDFSSRSQRNPAQMQLARVVVATTCITQHRHSCHSLNSSLPTQM